jgi:hypothetical protein
LFFASNCVLPEKISFSRCIGCTWQTKISFGRNYSKYFFCFFILQLFLAAFFWLFFTSLFYICCICAIVLLNKIEKKSFKKSFFIEVSFSVKIIGFEDLESRLQRQWGSCSSFMFLVDQHDLRKTKIQFHGGKNSLRTFFSLVLKNSTAKIRLIFTITLKSILILDNYYENSNSAFTVIVIAAQNFHYVITFNPRQKGINCQ